MPVLATAQSGVVTGLDAVGIPIEFDDNSRGLTGFTIVGLPDTAVQESRVPVRSAICNRNLEYPISRT
jgi:magnesium chelatase family protein